MTGAVPSHEQPLERWSLPTSARRNPVGFTGEAAND